MGIDLTLLPFDGEEFSHTMLFLDRADFDPIFKIEKHLGKPVPEHFTSFCSRGKEYSEPHYGVTTTTPYGDLLKYVLVQDIIGAFNDLADEDSVKNRAIYKYLIELESDTKVALYWH
jgi:hypothetical protein